MFKATLLIGILLLGGTFCSCASNNTAATKMPELSRDQMITNTSIALASMPMTQLYGSFLDTKTAEIIDFNTLMSRLYDIQVIYVSESHTNMACHQLQLKILTSLVTKNPKMALAMEFLYRSKQGIMDDYVADKIPEADFDNAVMTGFSEDGSWYPMYSPIIRFAKANKLKILGMNVERDVKRKMLMSGWDSLTPEEQKLIAKDLDMTNKGHRALFDKNAEGMKNDPRTKAMMQGPMYEMMYKNMVIWDETFGETIANYLKDKNYKDDQVMVILGSGHAEYKFNTPERSYKRYPASFRTLVPTEINDNKGKENLFRKILAEDPLRADFIYFVPVTMQ